jgi:cyclopropane fatty-acyl-phospholipid synthase-like methyltransferase
MPNSDNTMEIYSSEMKNKLWNDIAPGYYHYGLTSPTADLDNIPDLKQSNDDNVRYIIKKLGINKESHILELGCGKGMHTVRIAELTGCRYTGVDICASYIENDCKKWAAKHGVSEQGEFVHGDMMNLPAPVRERKYTHIIAIAVMLYGHNQLGVWLEMVADFCNKDTLVISQDFNRVADWDECADMNSHLKMEYPLLNKEEILKEVERSRLQLTEFEDLTKYVIPGYTIMEKECRKRDPEMRELTYPKMGKAMREGKISFVAYYMKLK